MKLFCLLILSLSLAAFASSEDVQFPVTEGNFLKAHLYGVSKFNQKRPGILIIEGFEKDPQKVPYKQLAQELAHQGFVVLSYNKRGIGENAHLGSHWENTLTREIQDAQSAFNYLKDHKGVNSKKLFVLGHCLGGPAALNLAGNNPLAGVLLVTSTIRNFRDLQLEQMHLLGQLRGWDQKKINNSIQKLSQQIQDVKRGQFKCLSPACELQDGIPVYENSLALPWWAEVLKVDTTDWALKAQAPVYFIFGESDFLAPKSDYLYVRDVIRLHKTKHLETRRIWGVDHFLVDNDSQAESYAYIQGLGKRTRFKNVSQELVDEITTWIRRKI